MNIRSLYRSLMAAFYYTGLPQLLLLKRTDRCSILIYHGVEPRPDNYHHNFIGLDAFARQMRYLKNKFKVIPLSEAIARLKEKRPFAGHSVVITFDDGYRNVLTQAYPVLKRLGLPFTVFLTTDYVSGVRRAWWDRLSEIIAAADNLDDKRGCFLAAREKLLNMPLADQEKYLSDLAGRAPAGTKNDESHAFMSWDEVRALVLDPLVEIGSHTLSHPVMSRLDLAKARAELAGSKNMIEEKIGRPVSTFAYPYGPRSSYSEQVITEVKKAGYDSALTGLPGGNTPGSDLFQLRRLSVYTQAPWYALITQLSGIHEFFCGLRNKA